MNRRPGWVEWRQARRNQIGIDEIRTCGFSWEILFRERRLSRAVGTSDDDDPFHRVRRFLMRPLGGQRQRACKLHWLMKNIGAESKQLRVEPA